VRLIRAFACLGFVTCFAWLSAGIAAASAAPIGAYTTKDTLSFVSAPSLHPPKMNIDVSPGKSKLGSGYIMISNFKDISSSDKMDGQGGPLILDSKMRPVWFNPVPTNVYAMNLHTGSYGGKPALSWWQGVLSVTGVVQSGEDLVVNQQYKTVATLKGADGWVLTPHELLISGANAWVTANKFVSGVNLTSFGGPANGTIIDSAVQEYNLKTGALVYSWDAMQHIPLSQSVALGAKTANSTANAWDAYHINSINLAGGEDFLVSMRNTWGAYLVNAGTNAIVWTLGTRHNDSFKLGSGATFEWQHDVELHNGNEVSMFDDACCELSGSGPFANPSGPSRGLVLNLNLTSHAATVATQYKHSPTLNAGTQGNVQLLAGGNAFVGWGSQPYFTEYSKSGKPLLDAIFPGPDISYRAYLESWTGQPSSPPSGAGRTQGSKTTIYASWNGATQVAKWEVLGGSSSSHLSKLTTANKGGFETAIALTHTAGLYEVEALDSKGHVLGHSKTFKSVKGKTVAPGGGHYY
jgi:Arylsulfotransferase (ASST)